MKFIQIHSILFFINVEYLYRLKIVLSRQANHKFTFVKTIYYDSVFSTLFFITREEVIKLFILISWFEQFRESIVGPTLALHLKSSGLWLLTISRLDPPSRKHLLKHPCLSISQHDVLDENSSLKGGESLAQYKTDTKLSFEEYGKYVITSIMNM